MSGKHDAWMASAAYRGLSFHFSLCGSCCETGVRQAEWQIQNYGHDGDKFPTSKMLTKRVDLGVS